MIPDLDTIDTDRCYTAWGVIVTSTREPEALWDIFSFLLDDSNITIDNIYDSSNDSAPDFNKLAGILVKRGFVDSSRIEEIANDKKLLKEYLLEAGIVRENQLKLFLLEQDEIKKAVNLHHGKKASPSIRVLTEKLDSLVDLVGEMVTLQASFRQIASRWDDISLIYNEKDTLSVNVGEMSHITGLSGKMEHLVEELRDRAMSLRMMPIGDTFDKFRRLVRDLSTELGKSVELHTSGGETELDKTVIEHIYQQHMKGQTYAYRSEMTVSGLIRMQ
jgi:two-component system chemotaxis sensor kinase CheA